MYTTPEVEIIEVEVEQGFSASQQDDTSATASASMKLWIKSV